MSFTREQINAAALELYGVRDTYDPAQVKRALDAAAALSTPPADDVREALVARMRKASSAVYLATDATVADDLSDMLRRAADAIEVRPHGTATDATVEQLREARAETWDEAVAAVFAWWKAPEDERPLAIVNPYGVGLRDVGDEAAGEVDQ